VVDALSNAYGISPLGKWEAPEDKCTFKHWIDNVAQGRLCALGQAVAPADAASASDSVQGAIHGLWHETLAALNEENAKNGENAVRVLILCLVEIPCEVTEEDCAKLLTLLRASAGFAAQVEFLRLVARFVPDSSRAFFDAHLQDIASSVFQTPYESLTGTAPGHLFFDFFDLLGERLQGTELQSNESFLGWLVWLQQNG
jgi:hypothetical protein